MSDAWLKERLAHYIKTETDVQKIYAHIFIDYFTSGEAERNYKARLGELYSECYKDVAKEGGIG